MTRRAIAVLGVLAAPAVALPAVGAAKGKPRPVGTIVSLAGSKKLTVKGARLGRGANLTLGEHLVMGAGLKATLRLTKPKGVSDQQLVDLTPAKGASFNVTISRSGVKITVAIAPA